MSAIEICRLCLSKNNLVWVFDKRFENASMKDVVFITTGVEICITDPVSQKICEQCCHIILKMFEFRKKSLENDNKLKEELNTTEVKIKTEKLAIPMKTTRNLHTASIIMHPTVQELYHRHPHIKLPTVCLALNVKPSVIMPMDQIEGYYKQRNLNFKEHCRQALKSKNTARKRTSPSTTVYSSPPCPINGQIIPREVEDTDDDVVRPIKIKIIPKIPTENAKDRIYETESQTEKTAPCHKKRKYSDSKEYPSEENEKSKKTDPSTNSLSYVANLSRPLYTCNICDAVHYSAKDLRKHRNKHLRCQFCKSTFRFLEDKAQHLEGNCVIKNAMNTIPCIELSKIETNPDIVKKYHKAFAHYSLINGQNCESYDVLSSESDIECIDLPVKHITTKETVAVIEILSDDEASMNASSIKNPQVSKFTPDLKIKDCPMPDCTDPSSNEVLKNLLNSSLTTFNIRTKTPEPTRIADDRSNRAVLLPNLKQHLQVFRAVPIVMKKGPFIVSYQQHMDKPKSRNMQLWNDLIPLDVKKNNPKVAATNDVSRSLSASDSPATDSIVQERICANTDDICTPIAESGTDDICSKSACDENYNNLSNSKTTTLVSIPSSLPNTNPAKLVPISAETVSNSSFVMTSAESVFSSSERILDSPSNQSTSTSANRSKTVIQWNTLPATNITTRSILQNILQPNPVVSTSAFVNTLSTTPSVVPTSLPGPSPPGTVRSASNVSTISSKPISFKIPYLHKIRNSSSTLRGTQNIYEVDKTILPNHFNNYPTSNCQRPQTPFITNSNQNTYNAIQNEANQQPINTSLNKNVIVEGNTSPSNMVQTVSIANNRNTSLNKTAVVEGNICPLSSSNVPPNQHKPITVQSTLWQPSSIFTNTRSNVSAITTVPQPVPPPKSLTMGSGGYYNTPQSNYTQFVPCVLLRNKIAAERRSRPSPVLKPIPPSPYHVAATFPSKNIHNTLPRQISNNVDDARNSFRTNVVQSPTPQPFQQISESIRSLSRPLVSAKSVFGDTTATSLPTSSQNCNLPTISAQANGSSCSVTRQQYGHIRVKNMQDMI